MTKTQILCISVLTLLFAGCAYTPQKADLAPVVSVMGSNEGAGVTVAVEVVDERPSKSLGRRGGAYGAGAEITAVQELAVVVHDEIVKALKLKGFLTEDFSPESSKSLKAEVRLLEYSTSTGFWTGGVHVNGAIKVIASSNGEVYEKMYRTDEEKRVLVVPDANSNEELINVSLSSLLSQIFEDRALIAHLAN